MQLPKLWVIGLAVAGAFIAGAAGLWLLQPPADLIQSAEFSQTRITPNADGDSDVTQFSYRLSSNATVTLAFESETGERYVFRDQQQRVAGDYQVLFSGVVDGFRLPGETGFRLPGEPYDPALPLLETRLLPDGDYWWTLTAVDERNQIMMRRGTLAIAEGDSALPLIQTFELSPLEFSPNQDGIGDWVNLNIFLPKAVTTLSVYLQNEAGQQIYIPRREEMHEYGEAGNHEYAYDGGVDQGFEPPPPGEYTVYAVAQDAEGQRSSQTRQLQIKEVESGLPQAEIMPQSTGATVCFEAAAYDEAYHHNRMEPGEKIPQPAAICSELTTLPMQVGDMLVFRLTVRNYGNTRIRTAGPFPGTVYDFNQNRAALGYFEEPGVWRIGLHCETAMVDFPWRWALAPQDELTAVYDRAEDVTYYYLEPGQRSEVWGAVRMTDLYDARNPQDCYAGLIHEGVATYQNRVGAREIRLVPTPLPPVQSWSTTNDSAD